jgi:hypothetical protein
MKNTSVRNIILLWLGWALAMIAFQHWVGARLDPRCPGHAMNCTAEWTTFCSQNGRQLAGSIVSLPSPERKEVQVVVKVA